MTFRYVRRETNSLVTFQIDEPIRIPTLWLIRVHVESPPCELEGRASWHPHPMLPRCIYYSQISHLAILMDA
jgi:hypothetical protein